MSDRFERMQYSLIWTATIYIQTRFTCEDVVVVARRKASAFVPSDKGASVGFAANQFAGVDGYARNPNLASKTPSELHLELERLMPAPLVGWKLVAQSPIYVEKIRLKATTSKVETAFELGVGACEGSVKIPIFCSIYFDLARNAPVADGAA